ncbi:TVP38/TMEM64 family protein [Sporolactobacillus sp. THM19-2]|uniref:TVP38/TMEM64 family protein n=1 Tax=Sporolactobacillus sp. THM19-2 TaxID=2511171 RepID=UPI00102256D2|nr:TVP38/TMEM64 family protein [Sporolactobacillus sp. THM19-2]RYL90972.1 TVP38/TMEM64 family protein [Sporolactobacillus sp. THM19-2]
MIEYVISKKDDSRRKGTAIRRGQKGPLIFNLIVFLLITVGIIWLSWLYGPALTSLAANPGKLERFLNSFGGISILIFIGLQMIQVIIAVVPGELLEIAGGYIYGTLAGSLFSIIGIALGSAVNFFLGRLFGMSLLQLFISKEKLIKMSILLNGQKLKLAILILFLLPGIPKDILCYVGGLLPVRPLYFLSVSAAARIPALLISCYVGANLRKENFLLAAIVTGSSIIIIVLAFLLKKRITALLHRHHRSEEKDKYPDLPRAIHRK